MKYLLAAGASVVIRGKTFAAGEVAEIPDNLYAAFDAAVQARLSVSVADADVDLTAYEIAAEGGGGGGSGTGDAIIDNADALTVDGITDIFSIDGAGVALASTTEVTNGLHFVAGNGVSGAIIGTFDEGDFLHAGILSLRGTADAATAQNIYGALLAAVGGIGATAQNAQWKGVDLNLYTLKYEASQVTTITSGGSDGSRWTSPSRAGSVQDTRVQLRVAIEREGTDLNLWLLDASNARILASTSVVAVDAGDIVMRLQTGWVDRNATLTLATSGLAWAGNRLVSAAA